MDKVIYNSMGSQCLKTKALDREGYANERNIAPEKNLMQCNVMKLTKRCQTVI